MHVTSQAELGLAGEYTRHSLQVAVLAILATLRTAELAELMETRS